MEQRVAILEEKARVHEAAIAVFTVKLDAVLVGVNELKTSLAIARSTECPAPGKCLALEKILSDFIASSKAETSAMKADILVINDIIAQGKGGWKIGLAMIGATGAICTLLTWILTHFHKPP